MREQIQQKRWDLQQLMEMGADGEGEVHTVESPHSLLPDALLFPVRAALGGQLRLLIRASSDYARDFRVLRRRSETE
jgi:hypothetical protein